MIPSGYQLPLGIFLAACIAGAAYFARSLNRSGGMAAFLLGSVIFGIGGPGWSVLLLAFFLSSSLLSRLFKKQKKSVEVNFSKGSRRDAGQVAANGAVAGICVLLYPMLGNPGWLWAAYAGALAAANADTWGTEIGILGKAKPRMITTGRTVESGTSGGVSLLGLLAGLSGAFLIAILAAIFKPISIPNSMENNLSLMAIVTIAGVAGSLFDSLLGAVSQAMYYCNTCKKETEKHPLHGCGNPTRLIRGKAWLNNDWVNTFCTLSGSFLAAILSIALVTSSSLPKVNVGGVEMIKLTISSPSFANNQPIPGKFSCDGENISPALQWGNIPSTARSLALIMDDPDAPIGTYTHWVIYNLPPSMTEIPEGVPTGKLSTGGIQGFNSARTNGYFGPCPPTGKAHHYFFKLYATDLLPNLPDGLNTEKLTNSITGHILASGECMGTYGR